ncbi:MAG: hypothetical protein OEO18_01340 [Gammaproteobacteria bacterium]|nr:hypothetical protein [Gammaproteobacteria bacterium]
MPGPVRRVVRINDMPGAARGPFFDEIDVTRLGMIITEFKHRIDRRNGTDA